LVEKILRKSLLCLAEYFRWLRSLPSRAKKNTFYPKVSSRPQRSRRVRQRK